MALTSELHLFKVIEEIAELILIVACIRLILGIYIRRYQSAWSKSLEKRKLATLLVLILAVTAIKVSEDAIGGESGPIDNAILIFIHSHVPNKLTWLFEAVTLSGSSTVLLTLAALTVILLLYSKHCAEALIVAASTISSAIVIYIIKAITSRDRPKLWEDTVWYWGSSFPSGHTLAVAALATAIVLCVSRIRPASRNFVLVTAVLWIFLVAISRLVLGVHWPTDVLAAACIGAFIPLAMSVVIDIRNT
ncbi:MAG: phosphatase PAP2 family protein [Methylotenera sp.]|nr:phosphatase PAP2 family protein [Methylotenera sp.]NOU40106.1 phosphatase PAP2 family protein [Methylotenera sp.]